MIAKQIESAPGDPFPLAWVQGCPSGDSMNYTIGFINQFSLGNSIPYLDIDCRIITNSFDPNDKQDFPNGYEIHFRILRFWK